MRLCWPSVHPSIGNRHWSATPSGLRWLSQNTRFGISRTPTRTGRTPTAVWAAVAGILLPPLETQRLTAQTERGPGPETGQTPDGRNRGCCCVFGVVGEAHGQCETDIGAGWSDIATVAQSTPLEVRLSYDD